MRGGIRTKITEGAKDRAVALYMNGATQDEVARELGFSNGSVVCRLLKGRGIKARPFVAHNKKPTDLRSQAVALYVEHTLTIPETAAALGLGTTTVARWLKAANATRAMGDAFALAIQKGRKGWGRRSPSIPWQSQKTGRWEFADSRWEALRMQQLDEDKDVLTWTRTIDRIPYIDAAGKRRYYAPDFLITYQDGRRSIEEIKPVCYVNDLATILKADAARKHLEGTGISYRIVTEQELGADALASFRLDGLQAFTEEERRLAHNRRKNAEIKRRNAPRVNANRDARHAVAQQIIASYQSGNTLEEVAKEFNRGTNAVRYWLEKYGISRRVAKARPHKQYRPRARSKKQPELPFGDSAHAVS